MSFCRSCAFQEAIFLQDLGLLDLERFPCASLMAWQVFFLFVAASAHLKPEQTLRLFWMVLNIRNILNDA